MSVWHVVLLKVWSMRYGSCVVFTEKAASFGTYFSVSEQDALHSFKTQA